jgi:hypothetical protein
VSYTPRSTKLSTAQWKPSVSRYPLNLYWQRARTSAVKSLAGVTQLTTFCAWCLCVFIDGPNSTAGPIRFIDSCVELKVVLLHAVK